MSPAPGRSSPGLPSPQFPLLLSKQGGGDPAARAHPAPTPTAHRDSQAGVHALTILLVLQPRLGQVDGEHAGDPNQPGDAAIDELGWQTVGTGNVRTYGLLGHRAGGWGGCGHPAGQGCILT